MSGLANDHCPGVAMQRSLLLLSHAALGAPVLIDLFRLRSDTRHRYDYALQYSGQICDTTLPVAYNGTQWSALGDSHGYQHLMGVARAEVQQPSRLTWLQGRRFNTWLSAATSGELVFAQLGANDPGFNLRRKSTLILRQQGGNHLFASAFETHDYFDEPSERCHGAGGVLNELRILGHDDQGSVVELTGANLHLLLMVSNRPNVKADTLHELNFGGSSTGGPVASIARRLTVRHDSRRPVSQVTTAHVGRRLQNTAAHHTSA